MKSNPRPKREGHTQPEKDRTESTGSGLERTQQTVDTRAGEAHSSCTGFREDGEWVTPRGLPGRGVSMALTDEHG